MKNDNAKKCVKTCIEQIRKNKGSKHEAGLQLHTFVRKPKYVTSSAILDLINTSLTIIYYENGRKYQIKADNW